MPAILLWLTVGLIPVPPAVTHSQHTPGYGALAPVCKTAHSSQQRGGKWLLTITVCGKK